MREFVQNEGACLRELDDPALQVRIDPHSGPLLAGVIDEHKFSCDRSNDTVNTARRQETEGKANFIHICATTCRLVKAMFLVESRGDVERKGKGQLKT